MSRSSPTSEETEDRYRCPAGQKRASRHSTSGPRKMATCSFFDSTRPAKSNWISTVSQVFRERRSAGGSARAPRLPAVDHRLELMIQVDHHPLVVRHQDRLDQGDEPAGSVGDAAADRHVALVVAPRPRAAERTIRGKGRAVARERDEIRVERRLLQLVAIDRPAGDAQQRLAHPHPCRRHAGSHRVAGRGCLASLPVIPTQDIISYALMPLFQLHHGTRCGKRSPTGSLGPAIADRTIVETAPAGIKRLMLEEWIRIRRIRHRRRVLAASRCGVAGQWWGRGDGRIRAWKRPRSGWNQ